jgi:GTP cyclohydrolase IA
MTLSFRPELSSAEQIIASVSTQQQQKVTDVEMMQAVRTLLIGLGEDPDREGLKDTPFHSC